MPAASACLDMRSGLDQLDSRDYRAENVKTLTLFLRDKPETDMREIAVLRFLCIGCCERNEQ